MDGLMPHLKRETRLKGLVNVKHSSLFRKSISDEKKMFYNIDADGQSANFKIFNLC